MRHLPPETTVLGPYDDRNSLGHESRYPSFRETENNVLNSPDEHRSRPAIGELLSIAPALEAHRPQVEGKTQAISFSSIFCLASNPPMPSCTLSSGVHSLPTLVFSTHYSADYALSASPPGRPWPRPHKDPSLFTHSSHLLWQGWHSYFI